MRISVVTTPEQLSKYKGTGVFEKIQRAFNNLLKSEAKTELKMFDRTVRTWKQKPEFSFEIKGDYLEVGTDDKVYGFLNFGTSVRRAKMSEDFIPKTQPGRLNAYVGKGRRRYVSKKLNLPGIDARDWVGQIGLKREPIFVRNFERYIAPYANKLLYMDNPGPPPNRFWNME